MQFAQLNSMRPETFLLLTPHNWAKPFSTYNRQVGILYPSCPQPVRPVPDHPRAMDPLVLRRSWMYKQLCRNSPPIGPPDQAAAIPTTVDQAACDGERRLDLCIKSAQMLFNPREMSRTSRCRHGGEIAMDASWN